MKDTLKYIFIIAAACVMASCTFEEQFEQTQEGAQCREVEIIARPTNFIRTNVATKAEDDFIQRLENDIHTAYFLMYDSNGRLLRYENLTDEISSSAETLSQSIVTDKGMTGVTVCYLANLPESFVQEHMEDLETLQGAVIDFRSTSSQKFRFSKVADTGYVGVPTVDLDDRAVTANVPCMPMLGLWTGDLNGTTGPAIEVPVKRLFAKIGFNINLDLTDGSAQEEVLPQLVLNSIVVNNVPTRMKLFPQEEESEMAYANTGFLTSGYREVVIPNPEINNGESVSYFFYVPEYVVEPNKNFEEEGWYKERNERYKPELAGNKKATYVSFDGILTKQGKEMEVSYKIYLGENNFDSFTMRRNYLYDNYIRIHGTAYGTGKDALGLDHRVDVKYTGFLVGFQRATLLDSHFEVRPLRVKFAQDFISQHRNTKGTLKVEILPDVEGQPMPDWLVLERPKHNTTDPIYCLTGDKFNHTKRRYFTENLVTETLKGQTSVSYDPFATSANGGDLKGDVPIWVYIDEYSANSVSDYSDEAVRRAKIRVSFTPNNGEAVVSQDFTVQQRAIYPIPTVGADGQSRTYGIEYFEEYLHNYDSQDNYGAEGGEYFTSQDGIKWGFDGVQFSDTDHALYFTGDAGIININDLANAATANMNLFYDFYLERDRDSDDDEITTHDYSGYDFNLKIINKEGVAEIDRPLNQNTESVIEYCFNKNKRNADGKVVYTYENKREEEDITTVVKYYRKRRSLLYDYYRVTWYYRTTTHYTDTYTKSSNFKWYAPAIDELEDIVVNGVNHDFFSEVFVDNLYWSAQPAYDRNFFQYIIGYSHFNEWNGMSLEELLDYIRDYISISLKQRTYGIYMSDNTRSARATKYDPYSTSDEHFISSDFKNDNIKEGYKNATTMYGGLLVNNYVQTPNSEDGDFVYNIDGTFMMNGINWGSLLTDPIDYDEEWVKGDKVAATSYKRMDGVTDIKLPEGIQNRSSEHRVRCIYNPTQVPDKLISSSISKVETDSEPYDYLIEKSERLPGFGWPASGYVTITDESQIKP